MSDAVFSRCKEINSLLLSLLDGATPSFLLVLSLVAELLTARGQSLCALCAHSANQAVLARSVLGKLIASIAKSLYPYTEEHKAELLP